MINIYAKTFMKATRMEDIRVHDVLSAPEEKRRRWFEQRKTRCIDPRNL